MNMDDLAGKPPIFGNTPLVIPKTTPAGESTNCRGTKRRPKSPRQRASSESETSRVPMSRPRWDGPPRSRWRRRHGGDLNLNTNNGQSELFFSENSEVFLVSSSEPWNFRKAPGFTFFMGNAGCFDSDPHNGLILSSHNWVVFSSQIYPFKARMLFIAHPCLRSLKLTATSNQQFFSSRLLNC